MLDGCKIFNLLNSLFFIVCDSPRLCLSPFRCSESCLCLSLFAFPRLSRFLSLFQLFLSKYVCVCVCVLSLWSNLSSQNLGRRLVPWAARSHSVRKNKRTKDCPPTPKPPPQHTCLLGSCCDSAKGRERGRHQGKKEGENGTMKEGQEIKDQGSREEEKAPAAPANRFSAMPALLSVF